MKKKFAMVKAIKKNNSDEKGDFTFGWTAQIFVAGSREKKFFKCMSDVNYCSRTIAFRRGCEIIKRLGYTIIEDFIPKEKRIN